MGIYSYPPSSRDIECNVQKRRAVCFQRLKFVFASVFPFCCFCWSFYSFCFGAQFCCVKFKPIRWNVLSNALSCFTGLSSVLMIWSNFIHDATLLVNHCKFPVLPWSHKTVVLTKASHQQASSWQGRHRAWALRTWRLATCSNYIPPILIPAAMSAGYRTFAHVPPCAPHHTATQLLGSAPDASAFHHGWSDSF